MGSLPIDVQYAVVTGWIGKTIADSVDDPDKLPQLKGMEGTVTFLAGVERVKYPGAIPQPLLAWQYPHVCTLDEQGFLIGPDGSRDVTLVATGDNIPFYEVTFDLVGTPGRYSQSLLFPPGPQDLVTALEVPRQFAADLPAWISAVGGSEAAATRAEAAAVRAESFSLLPPLIEDAYYPGLYLIPTSAAFTPDPANPGLYLMGV